MSRMEDKIICRGLQFECTLGFHRHEKTVPQKIMIDLDVWVASLLQEEYDQVESIRFDYYEANQLIKKFFQGRRFNLVETVAHEVANLLLQQFKINSVQVAVTKFPLDMPNATSITYVCSRSLES